MSVAPAIAGSAMRAATGGPAIPSAVSTWFVAAVSTAQLRSSSAQPFGMSNCPVEFTSGQFQLMYCGEPKSPSAFTQPPSSTCTTSVGLTG